MHFARSGTHNRSHLYLITASATIHLPFGLVSPRSDMVYLYARARSSARPESRWQRPLRRRIRGKGLGADCARLASKHASLASRGVVCGGRRERVSVAPGIMRLAIECLVAAHSFVGVLPFSRPNAVEVPNGVRFFDFRA